MPITEHGKLGVHARPSNDPLVAVPFKKRRFLFTRPPSPPPQLPSSAPEECDAQCKPESSGLESPFSETCGHPDQADAVTGNKCAVTGNTVSSDFGEEVKDTDVNVSPTRDNFLAPSDPGLGQHVEANSVNVTNIEQEMVIDNKILPVMGSSQPLSVMQETLEVPQKVGSDEGKIVQSEGTLVLNSNTLLVMGNTQPPSEMQKTFEVPQKVGSDEGKIVLNEGTSVLDNEVLPVMGSTQPPAVTQETLDVAQKVGSDEDKIVQSEGTLVLNNKDKIVQSEGTLVLNNLPVMGSTQPAAVMQETLDAAQKVGSSEGKIVQSERTLVLNNKVIPVIRSTPPPAVMQETLDATQKAGRDEGKPFLSEGIPVTVDNVEQKTLLGKSSDTELKVDSGHLSLNRSNWDLNTTMDTWEGSKTDFASNHGTSTIGGLELDDMHIKGLEFGVKDSLYEGTSGANVMLGNNSLQTNGHDNNLLNLSTVVTAEHSNSVASLGLQLKPSVLSNACTTSANINTLREMPYLSLSVKPTDTVSSHSPQLAISVVKPEPFESDHRDTRKVDEMGRPNSLALKSVKSEPCEGHQTSKSPVSSASDLKSVCSIIVKQEPLALSQGCYKSPERMSIPVDLVSHGLSFQNANMHQNAGTFHDNLPDPTSKSPKCKSPERREFQMELGHGSSMQNTEVHQTSGKVDDNTLEDTCKPLGLDGRKLQSNINDPSTHITGVKNIDSQLKQSNDFPLDTVMPNAAEGTASKPLHIAIRPTVSDGNELNSMKNLCETDNLPPPHEPMVTECKEQHMTADGMPESVAYNSSEIDRIQNENGKVVEINETKDNISPGTRGRISDFESKVAVSHDAAGAKPLHKQHGAGDEDYEEGEVGDLALLNEGPPKENDVEQVKDISSVSPVDVPAPKAALAEEKEISMHNTSDVKGHGIEGPYYEKDVQGFSSATLHNGDSANSQPNRTIHKLSKDNIKKHKDSEREVKSDIGLSTNKDIKSNQADANNQQEEPEGSHTMLVEFSELCKTESSQADGAAKDVTNTGQHSRIIYLNSASNKLTSEKMKSESGRSSSSHIERGSPADRSFNHEKSHSRGSRDEPSKFGVDRRQFYQAGRQVTDFMCNRGRTDERLINLNGEKNADSDQLVEHGNRLNGVRFPRRLNDSEIDNSAASDGFNRKMRKRSNDEFQNLSRMPCRGRPSGARGQGMMGRHPIRDISPGRCIGRDVPDFALAREENLMRNLPDGMMEPTIPSHLHSQYERSEGIFARRERRSLSPSQRRGVALHLPVNCSKSYSRPQQRSPHQWTAPGRCPDGYTGPPELVRCRSPEMVRLDRMRSLHQRPCFQDEMVVRRRASPPYNGRQSDDVTDMVPPTREHNFPRHLRGSNRNIRRFNLIDPREIAEEDYFEPPLPPHEFAEEEEYADDRRCEERRGPIRSFRQHVAGGDDDDGEDFRFHVDDGPRTFRLCPENNEGFPEADSPRDFNGRFRNRLGNRSGRLRGIVQEQDGNYRHHEGQGWHDAGYGDVRMKRRRF